MHRVKQQVIILFQLQDFHSQQRPTAQIESSLSFFSRSPADLLLSLFPAQAAQIHNIQSPGLPGVYHLRRFARFHYDPCPQDFVSSDYLIDASLQRHKVQGPPPSLMAPGML